MDEQHKPSNQMTVHGKVGDHPRGNFWFADYVTEDDYEGVITAGFPWRVFIQLAGLVDHLSGQFATKEDAEAFIRDDILGAGAQLDA
jgi:hypothetical protein